MVSDNNTTPTNGITIAALTSVLNAKLLVTLGGEEYFNQPEIFKYVIIR